MSTLRNIICAAAAVVLAAGSLAADSPRQSVGLVLSGGGAKGIAHIGVIQALEDNDIPIDYITGTSMGAIVGGLYASGYTPDEMMSLIMLPEFGYWSTGRINPALTYYFNREPQSPAMFSVPLSRKGDRADSVPASIISGMPMSFAVLELFSAYTAQCGGDFDRLFVPFRCVASNAAAKRRTVFSHGNLGESIRASMAFPIVFQPQEIGDTLYYDGGIYDNYPFDVMRRDFAPTIMIGVNVSSSDGGPRTSLMDQLDNLVIQGHTVDLPEDYGINMRLHLDRFSLLDFDRAPEIYKVGYDYAMSIMDSIKARVVARRPREVRQLRRRMFKSATPYVRFDSVSVTGGSRTQNEYLAYLFRPRHHSDTIGVEQARDAFYRAISSGKIRQLTPRAAYNDSTGLFTLNLKAYPKGSLKGSLGGYITSSTSSYIYLSGAYSTMDFSSIDASLSGWIGQTTMAGVLRGRLFVHTPLPSAVGLEVVVSREKFYENDHIFYSDRLPTFVVNHEYFARGQWSVACGRHGRTDIGAGYGILRDTYFPNNLLSSYRGGRLRSLSHLGQVFVRYVRTTLDEPSFPRSGNLIRATAMGVLGNNTTGTSPETDVRTNPKWVQAELRTRTYPALSEHFTLGFETDILLSTRKVLPSYSATMADAPAFTPTPSSANTFRASFRSNSFIGLGLVPVYSITPSLAVRIGAYGFMPLRRIERLDDGSARYGKWFSSPKVFCEADVTYHLPFGTIAGYVNYSDAEGDHWNVGLSFGIYVKPPKFLR